MNTDSPKWRMLPDVTLGIIAVLLSLIVFFYPDFSISTMIFVLSIALFVLGLPRIVSGLFLVDLPNGLRVLNLVTGSIALAVSAISLLYPNLAIQVLIYLLSFGLLLIGVIRLVVGLFFSIFVGWVRAIFVIAGLFTIIVSFLAFVFPGFGFQALVLLLSASLLANGATRIVQGVIGNKKES